MGLEYDPTIPFPTLLIDDMIIYIENPRESRYISRKN